MADYFTPTDIQQTIPEADMTPLERLLLSHVFEAERDGDGPLKGRVHVPELIHGQHLEVERHARLDPGQGDVDR